MTCARSGTRKVFCGFFPMRWALAAFWAAPRFSTTSRTSPRTGRLVTEGLRTIKRAVFLAHPRACLLAENFCSCGPKGMLKKLLGASQTGEISTICSWLQMQGRPLMPFSLFSQRNQSASYGPTLQWLRSLAGGREQTESWRVISCMGVSALSWLALKPPWWHVLELCFKEII